VKAVFADTFFWTALTSTNDAAHEQAVEFTYTLRTAKTITTEDVLDEYLAYFAGTRSSVRIQAGNAVADILDNEGILVIPHSHETFLAGLELYCARPDKGYSLTDCISMQIMRREGLSAVLTNDRHFEQEGFRALFRV
jgi:predicted nucleic acid-binding protein